MTVGRELEARKKPAAIDAIAVDTSDNVATCLHAVEAGADVSVKSGPDVITMTVTDAIPRGHKIALENIAGGDTVRKYGEVIGKASATIAPGQHVHTHNVVD